MELAGVVGTYRSVRPSPEWPSDPPVPQDRIASPRQREDLIPSFGDGKQKLPCLARHLQC